MSRIARSIVRLAATLALITVGSTVFAQQPGEQPPQDPTWVMSGTPVTLFPGGDVYPVYVADPHRPSNVLLESAIFDNTICPDGTNSDDNRGTCIGHL